MPRAGRYFSSAAHPAPSNRVQSARDIWWVLRLNTGVCSSIAYRIRPKNQIRRVSVTKNPVYLVHPMSPTRCQGRGSRVAPGQRGEGMEAPTGSSVPSVNYSKRLKA